MNNKMEALFYLLLGIFIAIIPISWALDLLHWEKGYAILVLTGSSLFSFMCFSCSYILFSRK